MSGIMILAKLLALYVRFLAAPRLIPGTVPGSFPHGRTPSRPSALPSSPRYNRLRYQWSFCCFAKYMPDSVPNLEAANSMTATMARVSSDSGISRTSMLTSVVTMRHRRVDHLRDALADELAQRIHIVGVHRHDIAVGVGVKVADRQRFHVAEKLGTETASYVPWLTFTMSLGCRRRNRESRPRKWLPQKAAPRPAARNRGFPPSCRGRM